MLEYTQNGCAPEFALWSFVDLGYLAYYSTYLLATGAIQGVEGETFEAGRMGTYTIEKDPTRPDVDAYARTDGTVHGLHHRQRGSSSELVIVCMTRQVFVRG